jgi:LuxR family maltose regulon positive regulatory protein
MEALQAELALGQGRIAVARQWASRFESMPPIEPQFRFYAPNLTLAKAWLAGGNPAERARGADLLAKLRDFFETTHNTRFLIEALALQALLRYGRHEQAAARADLDQTLALAQPGGFIRLFIEMGPAMAGLLADLRSAKGERAPYIDQILAAFPPSSSGPQNPGNREASPPLPVASAPPLIEPLTHRELDVLALLALGLPDKEIAQRLVISRHTVRTHLKHIFAKLEARNRREAVVRADRLGLLPVANQPTSSS